MKVFLFFRLPFAGGGQSVAVWQSCLWSAIIADAIPCLWLMIVFENRFSAIISQTQTICDCNRLPSVCSNLLRPFDPYCGMSYLTLKTLSFCRSKQKERVAVDTLFVVVIIEDTTTSS